MPGVFNKVEYVELEKVDELDETERGEGGFGHTGVWLVKKNLLKLLKMM